MVIVASNPRLGQGGVGRADLTNATLPQTSARRGRLVQHPIIGGLNEPPRLRACKEGNCLLMRASTPPCPRRGLLLLLLLLRYYLRLGISRSATLGENLVFRIAKIFDRTFRALRPNCATNGAAVMDQEMRQVDPFVPGKQPHQILFDLFRSCLSRELQPAGEPLNVGVDNHSFSLTVRHSENDVCRFARDPGKFQQFLHRLRNLSAAFDGDDAARFDDVSRFVPEETRRVDQRLEFLGNRVRKLAGCSILPEQGRRDEVHHFVRALGGKNRRNEQL